MSNGPVMKEPMVRESGPTLRPSSSETKLSARNGEHDEGAWEDCIDNHKQVATTAGYETPRVWTPQTGHALNSVRPGSNLVELASR